MAWLGLVLDGFGMVFLGFSGVLGGWVLGWLVGWLGLGLVLRSELGRLLSGMGLGGWEDGEVGFRFCKVLEVRGLGSGLTWAWGLLFGEV